MPKYLYMRLYECLCKCALITTQYQAAASTANWKQAPQLS